MYTTPDTECQLNNRLVRIASVSLLEEFSNEKNAVKKTARKLAFSSTV
jgi:hypothetical protein